MLTFVYFWYIFYQPKFFAMKNSILSLQQLLMIVLVVFAFACGDDDEGSDPPPPTTEDMLVGTWTTSSINIELTVGEKSLADYLVEDLGWSEADANFYSQLFEAELESAVDGTLTFNDDGTYDSNFDDSPDEGTWSLSADDTTITLDAGTSDEVDITIVSITDTTLVVTLGDSEFDDLDDDPETPDEEITIVAEITLTM